MDVKEYKRLSGKHVGLLNGSIWEVTNLELSHGKTQAYTTIMTDNPDRRVLRLKFELKDLILAYLLEKCINVGEDAELPKPEEVSKFIDLIKKELSGIWIKQYDKQEGNITFFDAHDCVNEVNVRELIESYAVIKELGITEYPNFGIQRQ